ncbi:MAG: nucleoside-triphosphatase [Bacteroidota bacterium]
MLVKKNLVRYIYFISGEKNSGKTNFAKNLASQLKKDGVNLSGIFTEKNIDDTYYIVSMDQVLQVPFAKKDKEDNWLKKNNFYFNPVAIREGESYILESLKDKNEIILLDEIGPLEIGGEIWAPVVQKLLESDIHLILVIRKNIIPLVINQWRIHNFKLFDINQMDLGYVHETIIGNIREQEGKSMYH